MNRVLFESRAPRARTLGEPLVKLARRFLRELELDRCELSLTLVGDAEIRVLNKQWRRKDKATDVLSFPAGEQPLPPGAFQPLGDVVISLETARVRASEDGRPLQAELARYLAHGILHLLGHDHHKPAETRAMAAAEARLLGSAGMVEAALGPAARPASKSPRRK